MPQFREKHSFDINRTVSGLKRILIGMFKKVVIADRVAMFVDPVYSNTEGFAGTQIVFATLLFAVQIYCDFSAYSDIAIGCARIMGYDLMENFRQPYFACGIREFWQRWHISLSTWFRDYLYIPLGGNRCGRGRRTLNIFTVFLISGIWHGANWTFFIWGSLHGLYYLVEEIWCKMFPEAGWWRKWQVGRALAHSAGVFLTLCLVCISWIFFRANNVSDAFDILGRLFTGGWALKGLMLRGEYWPFLFGNTPFNLCVALVAILVLWILDGCQERWRFIDRLSDQPLGVRWGLYYGLTMGILLFGVFSVQKSFIYFQF